MCLLLLCMLIIIRRLVILSAYGLFIGTIPRDISSLMSMARIILCEQQWHCGSECGRYNICRYFCLCVMSKCVSDVEQKGRLITGHSRARHFESVFAFQL